MSTLKLFILQTVIILVTSEKLLSEKKFPVPRHILTDVEPTPNSSTISNEEIVLNSTLGLPLISYAELQLQESKAEEIRTSDLQLETTTLPGSLGILEESNQNLCTHPARCEPLPPNATCFDTSLPYSAVSYSFTGLRHYWEVQSRLSAWSALKHIPKCWAVIQPLLCAVYLPRCEDNRVELVAKHLCKVTRGPCRIVPSVHQDGWPDFLNCNNASVFRTTDSNYGTLSSGFALGNNGPRKKVPSFNGEEDTCQSDQSDRRLLRFNTSSSCLAPFLLRTTKPASFYDVVDECGLNCFSPQYTTEEHESIIWSTRWGASAGLICSLFAFSTTILVERSKKIRQSFTNNIILCMSLCSSIIMLGFLVPTMSDGIRRDVLCQSDGTRRVAEPDSTQTSSCSVIAFMIYFFSIAYGVWMVIFACSWSMAFNRYGKLKEDGFQKRQCSLHIAAWSIPFILTTVLFVTNVVEADSLSGVCFVGGYLHTSTTDVYNPSVPVWFVVLPFILIFLVLSVVAGKIFFDLHKASQSANKILPEKAGSVLKTALLKLGGVYIPTMICIIFTFIHHIHIFNNMPIWAQSLKDFLVCSTLKSFAEGPDVNCELKDRLSLLRVRLQLSCAFLPPFHMACLVWNQATFRLWKKFLFRHLCNRWRSPDIDQHLRSSPGRREKYKVGMKKHQLIAQAYAKRQELRETGRLSLSFNSVHENPMALALSHMEEGYTAGSSSNELSSSWAAALPRLVERRGGLVGAIQLGLKRSDSIDSKLHLSRSFSVRDRGLSWVLDSKQQSTADSQASQFTMNQSQLDHLEQIYYAGKKHRSRSSRFGKKKFFKSRTFGSRRSSFTSHENSSASQVLPAVTLDPINLASEAQDRSKKIVKTSLQQVAAPGKSIDVGPRTRHIPKPEQGDIDAFKALEEKLRHLAEASRTSHETFLPDENPPAPLNLVCSSVQTSLTDLNNLGRRPDVRTTGTQVSPQLEVRHVPTTGPASTTDSSQTESHLFLPRHHEASYQHSSGHDVTDRPHPIETNVIKLSVPHQSSTESSIPSSYEKLSINIPGPDSYRPGSYPIISGAQARPTSYGLEHGLFRLPAAPTSEVTHHNRGRRGGLVSDDPLTVAVMKTPPGMGDLTSLIHHPPNLNPTLDLRNFEEIELQVRAPGAAARINLDRHPDSIVALSTPSS